MRSLWPVMGVCVLVAACGRPNPGFGLIDSGDAGGSDGQSGSGSTVSSSVSSAPTSTEASTVTTGVVTGSEGTTDPVDPTSSTASGSTDGTGATTMAAGRWEFPTDCKDGEEEYLKSEFTKAAADTFLLNEVPVSECSFLMGGSLDPNCQDLEFGKSGVFQVFLKGDLNNNKLEDYVGIYAVRFATPTPLHEGIPIPEEKFLKVEARIHLFRPDDKNPWAPLKFYVRRFTDGDDWMTGEGQDFTPCHKPATSYRCRVCPLDMQPVDSACVGEWGGKEAKHKGLPYDPLVLPIQTLNVPDEPNLESGYPLLLNVFTTEDLAWLTTEGLMLMPGIDTPYKSIEVITRDSEMLEWHPGLRVHYCKPKFVAD